jgi:hypothetical protein
MGGRNTMITKIVSCLIFLLLGFVYSKDFDVDTSRVDKIILTVNKWHKCSRWPQRYCISGKKDIQTFITSYLRAEPSDIPFGVADSIITFVTKDKNNYSKFDNYFLPKGRPDSLLSYYLDLAVNKPNMIRLKIISDKFDLFDTTLNYLKAIYNVDSAYSDKMKLTSHKIGFKTKDFIDENDNYKFKNLLESIEKKSHCVSIDYIGTRVLQFFKQKTGIIPQANIYFPCRNVYDLAEVLKYLHTIEGIEVEEVEIKNYFEIVFWFEKSQGQDIMDEIEAKMEAAGITFSKISGVIED